jgi:dihydroorotase
MTASAIFNARIINEGAESEGDIFLRNGRIERLGPPPRATRLEQSYDAEGRPVLPGMIDDQVHFREPGLTHKGDFASESTAAVVGGITSFFEMPNTRPPTLDAAALEGKYAAAAGRSPANYGFYLGASHDNLEAIARVDPHRVPGVKVFMGASTGNMLVDDPDVLAAIFANAPVPIVTHCEDTPTIQANEAAYRAQYGEDVPMAAHPAIRSAEACYRSSTLAVELAQRHGASLHILHLTTARELELFSPGPVTGKSITAEVCVHHLTFTEADYASQGSWIKCNPAIKTAADRDGLWAALADGRIDIIATDHAPHTRDEKANSYFRAPAGIPLVECAIPVLLDAHAAGQIDLPGIAEKTAHNVARRFAVRERGFIREGFWGDLIVLEPDDPWTLTEDQVRAKCGWSPFIGHTFAGRVAATWVGGQLVQQAGRLTGAIPGQALEFR